MSYKKISILIPTRRRLDFLTKMMNSYFETLVEPDLSEFVFRCDKDDIESVRFLSQYDWPIIVGPRREGYKSLPTFYNEMAGVASGDLLICGNDDMRFATRGWQSLIIEEADKYPDGIFNIGVSTGLNDDKFPFSIVSRRLVDAMGQINDPRLLFSDIYLLDVTKHFGRAIRTDKVAFPHDWAGHTDDEVRREANQHEFGQVFADATGAWSEEYRERHERVVAESIARIDPGFDFTVTNTLQAFESYTPPPPDPDGAPWPPQTAPASWGSSAGVPYDRDETVALFKALLGLGIKREQAIVSSQGNGLPSLLWEQLFDRVLTVAEHPEGAEPLVDGKQTLMFGSVATTRFMLAVLERAPSPTLLVLDDRRYSKLISPYYLVRHAMAKPGVIVFVDTAPRPQDGNEGMQTFLAGLRSGETDGIRHDIRDIHLGGRGFSYELVT